MALARCVLAVILGALPAVAGADPAAPSPLHRPQTSPPRPPHARYLPSPRRPPRTPRFPLPPGVPAAQRSQVLTARHTPPGLPRGCGAGELWGNTTDLGVPCLHWAKVPPFLERSPPVSWAELRGQPHNFCRSPDGAGRPWCFYRNAQGKVDWGYCDCSQGEWCAPRRWQLGTGHGGSLAPGTVSVYPETGGRGCRFALWCGGGLGSHITSTVHSFVQCASQQSVHRVTTVMGTESVKVAQL